MKDNAEPKSGNAQTKWNKARVVHDDDDGFYWRISFDKERYEEDDEMICNSDYRLDVSPESFGDLKDSSIGRTMRELIDEETQIQNRNSFTEHKSRKWKVGSTDSVKKIEIHGTSTDNLKSFLNSDLQTGVKGYVIKDSKLKSLKNDDTMLKNEKQRRRSKQDRRVNAQSPRTLTRVDCRIRALENMKRARLKMKEMNAFSISLDCNAIVKSSFDPEMDFRESMKEVMMEKGMRQRDKMEELLACYLTLNCDEYHHLIVKVFQETYNQFVNL